MPHSLTFKFADQNDWNTAFRHLWPRKGHILKGSAQNYWTCKYYLKWKHLIAAADAALANAMRKAIRKQFDKFLWIPRVSQDRMWDTGRVNNFTRLPLDSSGPAPQILVRTVAVRWED